MSKKQALEFDCIAGSEIRDIQGEQLSVQGADISEIEAGRGFVNDNHGKGFFNHIGRLITAKKIFSKDDCDDQRQEYYWDKVKSPYIYMKGVLYDNDDHPNSRAAAAIIRNIHKSDTPLKIKASVEGGVVSRGIKDSRLLAQTKITGVALTFTPANQATLVEPLNLEKSRDTWEKDRQLIKSVMHLAKTDVSSFRQVTRHASAHKLYKMIKDIQIKADKLGVNTKLLHKSPEDIIKGSLQSKLQTNINQINQLIKALTAGYGGAGAPTSRTGGSVLQTEAMDDGRKDYKGFKYIQCDKCGDEQIYAANQCKCRKCGKHYSMATLYKFMVKN